MAIIAIISIAIIQLKFVGHIGCQRVRRPSLEGLQYGYIGSIGDDPLIPER